MGVVLFLALAVVGDTGAVVDAGKVSARGVAAADLRAPSAEIARVKAERSARDRAAKKILAALGKLKPKWPVAAREGLVSRATAHDVRYGSDGSVELSLTVDLTAPLSIPDGGAVDEPAPIPVEEKP